MFGFLKRLKPFPLTDEQVIVQALKAVPEYAKQHKGEVLDINECVKLAVNAVETVWKDVRFPGRSGRTFDRFRNRFPSEEKELKALTERVKPQLEERARALAYGCMKQQKVQEINLTAYEAMIVSELRARGYMFHFTWQKSKVLMTIKISDTLACTKEIKYSEIKRGLLPSIIADVAEAVDLLSGKNLNVSVWKMTQEWKSNTTWRT